MRKYLIMFGALVCMATLWADNVRFAVEWTQTSDTRATIPIGIYFV